MRGDIRKQTSSRHKAFPFDHRENLSGKVAAKPTDEVSPHAVINDKVFPSPHSGAYNKTTKIEILTMRHSEIRLRRVKYSCGM